MAESARLKNFGGVVRAGESYQGKQGPDYIPGVSAQTAGSQASGRLGDAASRRRTY